MEQKEQLKNCRRRVEAAHPPPILPQANQPVLVCHVFVWKTTRATCGMMDGY